MAGRTNRVLAGAAIGAIPGILLVGVGVVVGGEPALSFGTIGIVLAIVGAVVGAVVGGSRASVETSPAPIVGAVVGAIPGLALTFIQTRLAFPVILVGSLVGWFLGSRIHPTPPSSPT